MSTEKTRVRRTFTEEFKRDAVNLALLRAIRSKRRRNPWESAREVYEGGTRNSRPSQNLVEKMPLQSNFKKRFEGFAKNSSVPSSNVKY